MKWTKHDHIKLKVAEYITQSLKTVWPLETSTDEIYKLFTHTPNPDLGHVALPMFTWSKTLKKSPAELAKNLVEILKLHPCPYVERWQAVGPYVNLFYDHSAVAKKILPEILNLTHFQQQLSVEMPKTMVEYSQPNTHKELHVGHMRNLCLGNALIRILKYVGGDIITSTFPGDVGTHVAKCLWYFKNHYQGSIPETEKGAWLGHLYTLAHNKLEDERGTPQEEKNRQELTTILKQLEKKSGPFFELWKETRQWSVDLMHDVYRWAGVDFDVWYWESEVDSDSIKLVKEYLSKGIFVESEGAIGADLSAYKLGFCLLIKSDGNGLYATKDIELAHRKFRDYGIQKNIYVVDKRQAHHFEQVFKCLELMGFEQAKDCYHLQYDFVELPDGPMSSRKGNIIPLQQLIREMESTIKSQYLKKYDGVWDQQEIEQTAAVIAKGAIKFGMTRIDPQKKIVFDMSEWLKLDGESGPYLQYVYARIQSLLSKVGSLKTTDDWSHLIHPLEHQIIRLLKEFNHVVITAAEQYKPSSLTAYLYDLAKAYNSFYAECPIISAQDELKHARGQLSMCVALTLKKGLELLGIDVPPRM